MWAAVFYGGSKRKGCLSGACAAIRRRCAGAWLPAPDSCAGICWPASLDSAFSGVDTAFYLVHSMNSGDGFEATRRPAPPTSPMARKPECAASSIWARWPPAGISPHMRSRLETGNILRSGAIPVLEFQASVIIGSGSASFELIRALVERLPVMITPLGQHCRTTHRHRRCHRVPHRGDPRAAAGECHRPNRRERCHFVCRADARIRPPAKTTPLVYTCSVPEPILIQPLADADHTGVCIHRPVPD